MARNMGVNKKLAQSAVDCLWLACGVEGDRVLAGVVVMERM